MRKPQTVKALEELGRIRLSKSFFMRDFLYSEISQVEGIPNIPDDPELAIAAGKQLCEQILEPIQSSLGRISIRSAYRASAVNAKCQFGSMIFSALYLLASLQYRPQINLGLTAKVR